MHFMETDCGRLKKIINAEECKYITGELKDIMRVYTHTI